jgi:serine/threonine-protein kinase SRPK3
MHGMNTFLRRLTFTRLRWVCLPKTFRRRNHNMTYSGSYQLIEEETLPLFNQKRYYPVKIGDIFKQQYRIIAKLGYGAYSTVWLARDEKLVTRASL